MRAGDLRRRIQLQRADVTQDSSGEEILLWVTFATVWADIKPVKGVERYSSMQFVAKEWRTFRIRFSSTAKTLTDKDSILFNSRLFNIQDVRELGFREGLEIDAYTRGEAAVES